MLVFLPGWSQIFALLRQLQQHPVYGGPGYRIIPLHSQLPREDQRAVFEVGMSVEFVSMPFIGQLSPVSVALEFDFAHFMDLGDATWCDQDYIEHKHR